MEKHHFAVVVKVVAIVLPWVNKWDSLSKLVSFYFPDFLYCYKTLFYIYVSMQWGTFSINVNITTFMFLCLVIFCLYMSTVSTVFYAALTVNISTNKLVVQNMLAGRNMPHLRL